MPYPSKYNDKWDAEHVKMPCSPSNLYPVNNTRNVSSYHNKENDLMYIKIHI